MDDNAIIALVLRISGNLTNGGYEALAENIGDVDDAVVWRINEMCPRGTDVEKISVERALMLESKHLEVQRWSDRSISGNPEPIDISMIERALRACDPDDPEYDREFHLALFREKPQFFGPDGLPPPD